MPSFCAGYLAALLAVAIVLGPGMTVSPEAVRSLGYYGRDYEQQLCGQSGLRELKRRAFVYYMQPHNLSSGVCVGACPTLADELVCDYTYTQSGPEARRAQLGKRCFGQLRTRPSFLACLPTDPGAASTIDAWLSAHAWDQIGADTLEASGVIFSCWCGAAVAGYVCLLGLRWLPRTTLFATLMSSLLLAPAFGALLLSHGYDGLAAARQHAALGGTVCARDRQAAQAALVAGWVAVLTGVILLVSLSLRARHAPLAAATLDAAAHVLQGLPGTYLLLPLYVAVASGAVLVSWLSSLAAYAAPSAAPSAALGGGGALSGGIAAPGGLWAWSILPLVWLLALLSAWEWSVVSGAVATWYAQRHAPLGAPRRTRSALWRSGCLSLAPSHVDQLGAAAALLPLSAAWRVLLPDVGASPRRDASPVSRLALSLAQRLLLAGRTLAERLHPGAIVQLVLRSEIAPRSPSRQEARRGAAEGGDGAEGAYDPGAGHWAGGPLRAAEAEVGFEAGYNAAGGDGGDGAADGGEGGDGLLGAAARCAALHATLEPHSHAHTRLFAASCPVHNHVHVRPCDRMKVRGPLRHDAGATGHVPRAHALLPRAVQGQHRGRLLAGGVALADGRAGAADAERAVAAAAALRRLVRPRLRLHLPLPGGGRDVGPVLLRGDARPAAPRPRRQRTPRPLASRQGLTQGARLEMRARGAQGLTARCC